MCEIETWHLCEVKEMNNVEVEAKQINGENEIAKMETDGETTIDYNGRWDVHNNDGEADRGNSENDINYKEQPLYIVLKKNEPQEEDQATTIGVYLGDG